MRGKSYHSHLALMYIILFELMIWVMLCRILQDMAIVVGAKVPWTTARLVQEALDLGLHVVEDPPMIKLLGRTKFVDMVVRGTVGWQEGVRINLFLHIQVCITSNSLVFNVIYNVILSITYAKHLFTIYSL